MLITMVAILLVGCTSLFKTTITITEVVDSAMKNWAALSVAGQTTPATDARVKIAHDKYRAAAAIVQSALVAYKRSGDNAEYIRALEAVKAAAGGLIDLIVPLLSPAKADTLLTKLEKASVP